MGIAQSLYEGVDLGTEGTEGLITYMRTDSVRVEMEAINAARALIDGAYGKNPFLQNQKCMLLKKEHKMLTKPSDQPT